LMSPPVLSWRLKHSLRKRTGGLKLSTRY